VPAKNLGFLIAEDALGTCVPCSDTSFGVKHEDGVICHILKQERARSSCLSPDSVRLLSHMFGCPVSRPCPPGYGRGRLVHTVLLTCVFAATMTNRAAGSGIVMASLASLCRNAATLMPTQDQLPFAWAQVSSGIWVALPICKSHHPCEKRSKAMRKTKEKKSEPAKRREQIPPGATRKAFERENLGGGPPGALWAILTPPAIPRRRRVRRSRRQQHRRRIAGGRCE